MDGIAIEEAPESRAGPQRRRWLWLGALAAAILLGGVLYLRSAAPAAGEEGAFANDCCGTLRLEGGRIRMNEAKQTVAYSVGRDSAGPYILPATYVGAFEDRGFEVDGTRAVLKLRLDRLPAPETIEVYEGSRRYVLSRSAAARAERRDRARR